MEIQKRIRQKTRALSEYNEIKIKWKADRVQATQNRKILTP